MRQEKVQMVKELGETITSSPYVVLVSYKGLSVDDFNGFRAGMDQVGASCKVVPNRLFLRAISELGWNDVAAYPLKGDTAMIFGGDDIVAVAKKLKEYAKEHDEIDIKIGSLQGKVLAKADVETLATLPSREVLLAQLLGILQAPSRNLVSVMQQKVSTIAYALQAYLDKRNSAE